MNPDGSRKRAGKSGRWGARVSAANAIDRVPVSLDAHHRLPTTFASVTSFPLNRAADAGSWILRLVVVRYMTARCTSSGSAAGFHLQVERHEFGQTVPSETAARAPAPAVSPSIHQPYPPPWHWRRPPDGAIGLNLLCQSGDFMDAEFATD
jgi:hypothetical protein